MSDELVTTTTAAQQSVVIINPLLVPVKQACLIIGRSQSALYELLGRGEIEGVKSDGRTLIVFESLRAYADRLRQSRPARITPSRRDRRPQRLRQAEAATS
jgi:hypothetical protein